MRATTLEQLCRLGLARQIVLPHLDERLPRSRGVLSLIDRSAIKVFTVLRHQPAPSNGHEAHFDLRWVRKAQAGEYGYQVASFAIHVEPVLSALAPLRRSLDVWLERRGMSEAPRAAVVLATHEAVANAIQHSAATTPVTVRGESRLADVLIEITDDGQWKTPDDPASEDRGRGLDLIRSLVSQAEICESDNGTTIRLVQHRA